MTAEEFLDKKGFPHDGRRKLVRLMEAYAKQSHEADVETIGKLRAELESCKAWVLKQADKINDEISSKNTIKSK